MTLTHAQADHDRVQAHADHAADMDAWWSDQTRCAVCAEPGHHPGNLTAHYTLNRAGAFPATLGVDGVGVRLHPACAAAVTEAARVNVTRDLLDRATAILAALPTDTT
jgi:hypothetical protein